MNELQLSKDLNVITAEINSYKQVAGQAIFEIGRRLKKVRDNPDSYGFSSYRDWELWCKKELEISRTHANRFIKVSEEFETQGVPNLGIRVLYEIATLPEEERGKEHTTSKGEVKTVDEMTRKELMELKKQLKLEKQERERLEQENEELSNQEPETIEVIPEDYDYYKGNYESALSLQERYKKQMEEMRDELNKKQTTSNSSKTDKLLKEKEKILKKKLDDYNKLYEIQTFLEISLSQMQPHIININLHNTKIERWAIDEFEKVLEKTIKTCEELKNQLPNKNIIEGEIVNE